MALKSPPSGLLISCGKAGRETPEAGKPLFLSKAPSQQLAFAHGPNQRVVSTKELSEFRTLRSEPIFRNRHDGARDALMEVAREHTHGPQDVQNAEIAEGGEDQSDERVCRDEGPKHGAPFTEQICDVEFGIDRANRAALVGERALRARGLRFSSCQIACPERKRSLIAVLTGE